jgi:hypothetical protein
MPAFFVSKLEFTWAIDMGKKRGKAPLFTFPHSPLTEEVHLERFSLKGIQA